MSGQDSEVTLTLSSPSQKLVDDFELTEDEAPKTYQIKEVQTEKAIVSTEEEYEQLLQKAGTRADFKSDLNKLSTYISGMLNQCPEMAPNKFEKICRQIGADKLFKVLHNCMSSQRMSDEKKNLAKLRAMVMMYSHSQRANCFQVHWPEHSILKEY